MACLPALWFQTFWLGFTRTGQGGLETGLRTDWIYDNLLPCWTGGHASHSGILTTGLLGQPSSQPDIWQALLYQAYTCYCNQFLSLATMDGLDDGDSCLLTYPLLLSLQHMVCLTILPPASYGCATDATCGQTLRPPRPYGLNCH